LNPGMEHLESAPRSGTGNLTNGEFAFSPADFRNLADLVKAGAGIDLPESKATLVYARLTKRLRELRLKSFAEYCNFVRADDTERHRMIAALTTNVTRFFRESHHFDDLKKTIIEPLAESSRRGRKVRIWSAACSTGQEPYSIAFTILSVLPEAARLDIKVLATDLNPFVVETGRKGIYESSDVKDIPGAMRARWTEKMPDANFRVLPEARGLISFRELNLMGAWPMKCAFDAVFCRNVVIYFDRPTQERMWGRMADTVVAGGALYIGHSERVTGPAARSLRPDGTTTYRKEGGLE
jgi:chemotaxis protein methyltransferase CheR